MTVVTIAESEAPDASAALADPVSIQPSCSPKPPSSGSPLASICPFPDCPPPQKSTEFQRFSPGVAYYGYRWYDPATGRWPSRDPIKEEGGNNLYCFAFNNAIENIENLGLYIHEAGVIGPHEALAGVAGAELPIEMTFSNVQRYLYYTPMFKSHRRKLSWGARVLTRLAAMHAVAKFYDHNVTNGSLTSGPGNRWVFTCKYGWIDMAHFYNNAALAYMLGKRVADTGSLLMEMWQLGVNGNNRALGGSLYALDIPGLDKNTGESAFTAEDLNSNHEGASFGVGAYWRDLEVLNVEYSSGGLMSSRFRTWLISAGAVDTTRDTRPMNILKADAKGWNLGGYYQLPLTFNRGDSYDLQVGRLSHKCLCDGTAPKEPEWTYGR